MSITDTGEFCAACQQEVIDFTNMSISEIRKIRGNQSEMCGKFRPEQVDPSLHPIELPNVRSWAFLSSIFVSLSFGTATAQSTVDPKIEQAQGTSNAPNLTPEEAKGQSERGQHISMSIASAIDDATTVEVEEVSKDRAKQLRKRRRKANKKLYWSARFPFIHRKRNNWRGKF